MVYVVVGLGNPGPTYAFTRHNVGFWAVEDLAQRVSAPFNRASRQFAEVATGRIPPAPVRDAISLIMVKPTTFMNNSGKAVRAVAAFHKVPADHIIAIHDELDLEPGQLRIKFGGGDNGHNGLKSMRAHLGTGDFLRVRVGIGRPNGRQPASDYVLARMREKDADEMRVDAAVAADAVEHLVAEGLVSAQNKFNS